MCKDSYSGGRCHLPPVKGSISMVSQLDPENSLCMHCGDSNFHLDASKTSVDVADMIRLSFHEGEEEVQIISLREVDETSTLKFSKTFSSISYRINYEIEKSSMGTDTVKRTDSDSFVCQSEKHVSEQECIQAPPEGSALRSLSVNIDLSNSVGRRQSHWIYINCTAEHLLMIGDGFCDEEYNTPECGNDGGDCTGGGEGDSTYPGCREGNPHIIFEKLRNGACDGSGYNSKQCLWDGGDCLSFRGRYPECNAGDDLDINIIANGVCDDYGDHNKKNVDTTEGIASRGTNTLTACYRLR